MKAVAFSLATLVQVKRALGDKAKLERIWDSTLHHPADLPFSQDMQDLPDVFTQFRNKVIAVTNPTQVMQFSVLILTLQKCENSS